VDGGESNSSTAPRGLRARAIVVIAVAVAVDFLLAALRVPGGYSTRLLAALAVWLVGVRLAPLQSIEDYPSWGRLGSSLRTCALVSLPLAGLAAIFMLVARFVFDAGLLGGLRPPFMVADLEDALAYAVVGGIAAPIVEEFIYRGVVQPRLRSAIGPVAAILVSGPLFWGLHWVYHQGVSPPNHLFAGWILAYAFERGRSLLAPTLLHAAGNLVVIGFDLIAFRYPGLFDAA